MKEVILKWLKEDFLNVVREGFKRAFKSFLNFIWENIKDDIHACAVEAIKYLENFHGTKGYEEKKEVIVNRIMEKVKLPFFIKPFKGIIKKNLKKNIEKVVQEIINKGTELTA